MSELILSGLGAAVLAAVHLFVGKLAFLSHTPRSRWLSFSGGIAVAYIFLHLLPELAEHHHGSQEGEAARLIDIFLAALIGLVVFYGLEHLVRRRRPRTAEEPRDPDGIFWIHIASFTIYNLLIGYLLVRREETGTLWLALYTIAMALHFVTNDFGLRAHHPRLYHDNGRYVLAGGVTLGWLVGVFIEVPEVAIGYAIALLGGGVILNVMKEELPHDRESRFGPFLAGAFLYAVVLEVSERV